MIRIIVIPFFFIMLLYSGCTWTGTERAKNDNQKKEIKVLLSIKRNLNDEIDRLKSLRGNLEIEIKRIKSDKSKFERENLKLYKEKGLVITKLELLNDRYHKIYNSQKSYNIRHIVRLKLPSKLSNVLLSFDNIQDFIRLKGCRLKQNQSKQEKKFMFDCDINKIIMDFSSQYTLKIKGFKKKTLFKLNPEEIETVTYTVPPNLLTLSPISIHFPNQLNVSFANKKINPNNKFSFSYSTLTKGLDFTIGLGQKSCLLSYNVSLKYLLEGKSKIEFNNNFFPLKDPSEIEPIDSRLTLNFFKNENQCKTGKLKSFYSIINSKINLTQRCLYYPANVALYLGNLPISKCSPIMKKPNEHVVAFNLTPISFSKKGLNTHCSGPPKLILITLDKLLARKLNPRKIRKVLSNLLLELKQRASIPNVKLIAINPKKGPIHIIDCLDIVERQPVGPDSIVSILENIRFVHTDFHATNNLNDVYFREKLYSLSNDIIYLSDNNSFIQKIPRINWNRMREISENGNDIQILTTRKQGTDICKSIKKEAPFIKCIVIDNVKNLKEHLLQFIGK